MVLGRVGRLAYKAWSGERDCVQAGCKNYATGSPIPLPNGEYIRACSKHKTEIRKIQGEELVNQYAKKKK